jgi:AraC-like DNA-binding protein
VAATASLNARNAAPAEGKNVTHLALEVGYITPSAFISMFRKSWGTTPSRCFGARLRL